MTHALISPMRRYVSISLLFVCACFSAQAQFSGQPVNPNTPINVPAAITTDPAVLFPSRPPQVVDQGDLLSVHIYGSVDYLPVVRVATDGTIQLPLIGVVAVRGLTLEEAEARIATALTDAGMYRNPQVNIQVVEAPNHVINVVGEVRTPMLVPAIGSRRLLDALDAAGGMTPSASHTITVLRTGVPQPIVIELGSDPVHSAASNIPIFSGDTIIVSRVGSYYVLGSVQHQGIYPLESNSPTTLINALTAASGPLFEAKQSQVRIIRTEGNTRKEVRVDLARIVAGKDPDPIIAADDIVYIPSNMLKEAIKSGGIATLFGAASLVAVFAYR